MPEKESFGSKSHDVVIGQYISLVGLNFGIGHAWQKKITKMF